MLLNTYGPHRLNQKSFLNFDFLAHRLNKKQRKSKELKVSSYCRGLSLIKIVLMYTQSLQKQFDNFSSFKPFGNKHGYNNYPFIFTAICRSEEHTSELQSRPHLVCRLL